MIHYFHRIVAVFIGGLCALVVLGGFLSPVPRKATVVIGSGTGLQYANSDTIFVSAALGKHINDSLRKYCGNGLVSVKSMLIAQPSQIVEQIDFDIFPELETLTFSGNDDDVLQNKHYKFMDVKSLKEIHLVNVYVYYSVTDGEDDDYTYKSKWKFKKFVHEYRPDVRVRWPRHFDDRIVWTD